MNKLVEWFVGPEQRNQNSDAAFIYKRWGTMLTYLTLFIVILFFIFLNCNYANAVITFLLVAGASFAGGGAIGFLFGLPRAEKHRYIKKEDADHNSRAYSYGDNTNLEEVSDWVTKIIVGLTLVKFNTILVWMHTAAVSIQTTFAAACTDKKIIQVPFNAYVFGYSTIIVYSLVGAWLIYIWARTNLSEILTKSRMAQIEVEKQQLVSKLQSVYNKDLDKVDGISSQFQLSRLSPQLRELTFPTARFRSIIESVYAARPVYDKTDIQKGRWGSSAIKRNYSLEANYINDPQRPELYKVQLVVRSLNADSPLTGEVAFFLHNTFPAEIVYTVATEDNVAKIQFYSYEAFAAGARLEDGTELELDLNTVKGFPQQFYYKQ